MKPTVLKSVIEKNGMNFTKAAKELGISRQTIHSQVRRHFDKVVVLMPKQPRKPK